MTNHYERKIIFLTIAFLIVTLACPCQIVSSISVGPGLGLGANFGKSSKASIGGSIDYVAKFSSIGVRVSGGYNKFKGKVYDDYVSFLPIRAGVQAFLADDLIFVYGEGGIAKFKASTGTEKTDPSFSFGAGRRQPIGGDQFIQLSVYFNYYKYKGDPPGGDLNYTWFNFRVAYGFSFGKKNALKE
jgi:hypothetical protein